MLLRTPIFDTYVASSSCHTQNLVSITRVVSSPTCQLVRLGGVCLGLTTNNVAKYNVVMELLLDTMSHHIEISLVVHLASNRNSCNLIGCNIYVTLCVRSLFGTPILKHISKQKHTFVNKKADNIFSLTI